MTFRDHRTGVGATHPAGCGSGPPITGPLPQPAGREVAYWARRWTPATLRRWRSASRRPGPSPGRRLLRARRRPDRPLRRPGRGRHLPRLLPANPGPGTRAGHSRRV